MYWTTLYRSLLVTLLVLRLVGGDYGLAQVGVWAKMIIERVQVTDFKTAVSTTFDGQHPCQHCHALKKAQQTENSSPADERAPGATWKLLEKEVGNSADLENLFFLKIVEKPQIFTTNVVLLISRLTHGPPSPPPRLA
jgi:hypothetical protein